MKPTAQALCLSSLSPFILVVGETVEVLVGMVAGTSVAGGKIR